MSKETIKIVTSNKAKFQEIYDFNQRKSAPVEFEHEDMNLFEIQTRDQKIIALHKAEEAWQKVGKPLLVEDTGIQLEKYGTFPGTLTKQVFKGIGYRGLFRLVDSGDRATFHITVVYVDKNGNPHVFDGMQEGEIVKPDKLEMNSNFPLDQIFVPEDCKITYAELKEKDVATYEKNSHRLKAINKMFEWIKQTQN